MPQYGQAPEESSRTGDCGLMVCNNTGLEGLVRLLLWRGFLSGTVTVRKNHKARSFYGWILEAPSIVSPGGNMSRFGLFWAVVYGSRRGRDPSSLRGCASDLQRVRADECRR